MDERLVLRKAADDSDRQDALWNLRVLFAWVERASRDEGIDGGGGKVAWLGREVVEALRGRVEERVAVAVAAAAKRQRDADSP